MSEAAPHVRVVLGQTGFGKTTLARALIAQAPRVVGFDLRREHDALALSWDDCCAFVDRMPLDHFRVTCNDLERAEELCALAYALGETVAEREGGARVTVLLEEADLIAPPGRESKALKMVLAQGRVFEAGGGLDVLAVSRRPAEVSRFFTALADEWYVFRTQEPLDVSYLQSAIGTEATAAVQALNRFEHVVKTPGGWTRRQLAVRG